MRGISSVLTLTIVFAGCASASSSSDGVARPSGMIAPRDYSYGGHVYVAPDTRAGVSEYAAPLDAVWNAAIDAYLELGIEAVIAESQGLVGNPRFEVSRRLAGERLSTFVRCGTDDTGMPAADSYRVRMDVRSRVTALSDAGARLETTITATARDVSGTAADRVQCVSTGALEERIALLTARHLDEGG